MAQGKLKTKAKAKPKPGKARSNNAKNESNKKGRPTQRRGNAPIRPKKTKLEEQSKLKKTITKTVNKAMEQELRKKALGGKQSLTKKGPTTTTTTVRKTKQQQIIIKIN